MAIRIDGDNATATPGITGGDADTGLVFGTDEVKVVTGGTDRVTVGSTGNLSIAAGNLVLASGSGIDFSATADSSATPGTQSELLDDYEEGTWTPVLGVSDENSSHTQNAQIGRYAKIGSTVYIWGRVNLSALGTNGNGVAALLGLPFAASNSGLAQHRPIFIGFMNGFTNNFVPQSALVQDNTTQARFFCYGSADRERILTTIGPGRYTSTSDIAFSGVYSIL